MYNVTCCFCGNIIPKNKASRIDYKYLCFDCSINRIKDNNNINIMCSYIKDNMPVTKEKRKEQYRNLKIQKNDELKRKAIEIINSVKADINECLIDTNHSCNKMKSLLFDWIITNYF